MSRDDDPRAGVHGDVGYLLNKATRQVRLRLLTRLAELGLRPQQAAALMAIARSAEGCLTPRQLADSIDTDAATTTSLLERLARDGWVVSQPNPADGRSRLVVLTEQARQVLPSVFETAEAVSHEATACLSPEEIATLRYLLTRLCADHSCQDSKEGGSE